MSKRTNWESIIPNFKEGDVIIPFVSEVEERSTRDYLPGFVFNPYGNSVLKQYACVKRADTNKVGVYDKKGNQIIPEEFDECAPFLYNPLEFATVEGIKVKKDGLYGLYDRKGKLIVPPEFTRITVEDYVLIVTDANKRKGAYSLNGTQIIKCEYNNVQFYGSLEYRPCGYAIVKKDGRYGVISEEGKEIVPAMYADVKIAVGGSFIATDAENPKLKVWYSRDGKQKFPYEFKDVSLNEKNGTIDVEAEHDLKGVYSLKGKEIVPAKFKKIQYMGSYIVGLNEADDLYVYDKEGNCLYHTKNQCETL